MFAYRFLPRRKYVVEIREYACESCPGCKPTRDSTRRYHDCIHLQTVKAVSYKGRGHGKLLRSDRCVATGWVTHKIVPITTTATTGETLTLTPKLSLPPPPSYRYQSYGRVGTGGLPAPVGVRRSVTAGRQRIHGEYERWRVWGAKAETFLGRTVATPPPTWGFVCGLEDTASIAPRRIVWELLLQDPVVQEDVHGWSFVCPRVCAIHILVMYCPR